MDAVVVLCIATTLVAAFWLAGLHFWAWFWVGLIALLGSFELGAKLATGRTLSQQFWDFRKRKPKTAWWLTGLLAVLWLGLLAHLNWK